MTVAPEDLQATFCATLVDEWARAGVVHAVVSPGSRSTPLALALIADGRLQVHVHQDERSAGFLALGLALGGWEPVIVLTTSGTAAVELHPAMVESDLAGVPLIVCTADRPPELLDVAAPQAIDQTHLFGRSARWFHAPGVADAEAWGHWRPLAARAYAEASGPNPGPVHLNLAFREPLVGTPGELPVARPDGAPWAWRAAADLPSAPAISLVDDLAGRRGVIVAGPGSGSGPALDRVARALGWPVLAAPQADVWAMEAGTIPHVDALLRVPELAAELRPEVVVRLGGPLASRVVGEWVAATGAPEITAGGPHRWVDPHGTATVVLPVDPDVLVLAWEGQAEQVSPVDEGEWRSRWEALGATAAGAIGASLAEAAGPTEPGIARDLVAALPDGACLVVSSSMPVRDVEWYVDPGRAITVHANRGANGIDGVVSTAVGVAAATGGPTALLIGDLAFLHDSNGLLGADRAASLVMVVVDNDGGGIFSFLPQAHTVAADRFETVYGTPHGLDLVAVAAAFGAQARRVTEVGQAVTDAFARGGIHVLVVSSDRDANVEVHATINAAVARAAAVDRV